MSEAIRYSDRLAFRCQPELAALVDRAAARKGTKPAEWLRQALQTALRLDGLNPTPETTGADLSNRRVP